MKTYPLRPRELYPFGIMRYNKDGEGINRPYDLIEGAKKMADDICPKCAFYHEDCPKPGISENIAVENCKDYEKRN